MNGLLSRRYNMMYCECAIPIAIYTPFFKLLKSFKFLNFLNLISAENTLFYKVKVCSFHSVGKLIQQWRNSLRSYNLSFLCVFSFIRRQVFF